MASEAHGAAGAAEGENDYIMEHLLDGPDIHLSPFGHLHLPHLELFGFDISITRHVAMMWLAAAFLIVMFVVTTRRRGLVPRGLANMLEAVVLYVRDEIARPNIGETRGRRFA